MKAHELDEQIREFMEVNQNLQQKDIVLQQKYYADYETEKNKLFDKELQLQKNLNKKIEESLLESTIQNLIREMTITAELRIKESEIREKRQ